jgi:hypothetical protein
MSMAKNREEGEEVQADQLTLLCDGVNCATIARAQMTQMLALYFEHCKREALHPHEGLVQGIEHSIRTVHVGHGKVCLDLTGRCLRDEDLLVLNCAFVQWHLANDTAEGATATATDTSTYGDSTASATCMRFVQFS